MYLIAGFLALSVAVEARGWSNGSQDASPSGALKTVTASGVGNVLLWLLAIGMLLYSAWRVVSTLLPRGDDPRALAHRLGYVVSALIYTILAVSAIALLRRAPGTADGTKKLTDITASMITHAVGRVAVGVVGAMVVGLGVYRFYKGVTMDAREELDVAGMSAARVVWTERLGLIGEVGRGIGISLVGFFMFAIGDHLSRRPGRGSRRRTAAPCRRVVGLQFGRRVRHRLRGLWRVLHGDVHPPAPAGTLTIP
jgi:hypothetical protein